MTLRLRRQPPRPPRGGRRPPSEEEEVAGGPGGPKPQPRASATSHGEALVWRAARAGRGAVLLLVTALALAIAEAAFPAVLGRAVDAVVGGAPRTWLLWCGLLVALLVACDALDDLAAGAAVARSTASLRHALVRHVLGLDLRAAQRTPPGEVAVRLVGNVATVGGFVGHAARVVANLVPAVGATVALALIDPWLFVTFLCGMPALVLVLRVFARDATDVARRYLAVQGTIASRLVDAVSGARTIAAAGTIGREARRVLEPLPQLQRHGMDNWRTQTRVLTQDALLVPLLELAVLAVAGVQLSRGRITAGQMLAASQYVVLGAGLGGAVSFVARLANARAAAARVGDVLDEPVRPHGERRLPPEHARLELRGVTVRDGEGRPVLDAVDLVIPAGTLVAVVGRSGAGKSLLAAVAGRLVDPDEGEVVLDGVPLHELARTELRREVTYGFERPVLLGETVAAAIAFGAVTPTGDDVREAARAAQADGFIRRMPEGYDTPVGDAPMSGGERQRVGLARAFAHAGRLVLLDDVAAALDTVTEHEVSRVLAEALGGSTRIVVAHRASTAARADAVVWLEAGRVRTVGSHRELWRDDGYRALFGGEPAAAGAVAAAHPDLVEGAA